MKHAIINSVIFGTMGSIISIITENLITGIITTLVLGCVHFYLQRLLTHIHKDKDKKIFKDEKFKSNGVHKKTK